MTSARSTMLGYIAGSGTSTPSIRRSASARHLMVSKVRGRFTTFEGELVTGANPLESSVTVSIDPNSIATGDENRDAHLRSADFLDVANYPVMTWQSTRVRPHCNIQPNGDRPPRSLSR